MAEDLRVQTRPKGRYFEDFEVGARYVHHWGRTLTEADNMLFTTLTLHYNPIYFNVELARAAGHAGLVVCPMLVFSLVFGLSVEDLSESGGAFLSVDDLRYGAVVHPGDTLYASSTVIDLRSSSSRPDMGIARWHTNGVNQRDEMVIDFVRTNLVMRRKPLETATE